MSVATWLKSVFTTQTATNYKTNIDACFAVAERIVDNFAPRQSNPPAMTVTLDPGALDNGQTLTEVAMQTTGTITAPVANPRIDYIVIDKTTGAVSVITGTPAASPVAPALTAGVFPVAQVLLQTTSTTIVNSMISDKRTAALVTRSVLVAPKPTTSGTSINFTGVPSWAKKIYVMFNGVSVNYSGTNPIVVQLGGSGGLETSGYASTVLGDGTSNGITMTSISNGFGVADVLNLGYTLSGIMTLCLMDASTNTWVATSTLSSQAGVQTFVSSGVKALANPLDRLSLVIASNAFDAGSISIAYE